MNRKKLSFLVLFLSMSSLFAADAGPGNKRPAEEQVGPAAQEENKTRKIETSKKEFLHACKASDVNTVRTLIEKGIDPSLVYETDTNGTTTTALGVACTYGEVPVVEALLERGVDPSQAHQTFADNSTKTALGIACTYGNVSVVDALLERGIDPSHAHETFANRITKTALGVACTYGEISVVDALLERGIDPSQPHETATDGVTKTALGVACAYGEVSVVEALLERGVSFKRVASDGRNAYQAASTEEIKEKIKKHAIKTQTTSSISLEHFKKNQRLHFLSCCCAFVFADEFSEWKYSKLQARLPLLCPVCQKPNAAKELNILEYTFNETQEEDEEPQAAAQQAIPDID